MASRIYNNFHLWLWHDNHKSGWPKFIDSAWLTWLSNWYWVTLWPKSNKLLYSTNALRWMYIQLLNNVEVDVRHLAFWDAWEIYNFSLSTDNTPAYTMTNWWAVRGMFLLENYIYILYEAVQWKDLLNVAQVLQSDVEDWTYASMNETLYTNFITHFDNPPILVTAKIAYIWGLDVVKNITASAATTSFSSLNWYVTWISKHLTQFTMYTSTNEVYYASQTAMVSWSWLNSWSNILDFPPRKVIQNSSTDYITTKDWMLHIWSWPSTQEITRPIMSNRLEDNTIYSTLFNFDLWAENSWTTMAYARWKLYVVANDTNPWIIIYWKLIQWVPAWFHKAITVNNEWEAFEYIYSIAYEQISGKIYYTYKTATKYWVDYIDLNSKETCKYWYWVTEIFSANTSYEKELLALRTTTSYTSWDNYVKVSIRINNWVWELVRSINEADDIIKKYENKTWFKKENIDIQFKVELSNETQWENAPVLHELMYNYNILNK